MKFGPPIDGAHPAAQPSDDGYVTGNEMTQEIFNMSVQKNTMRSETQQNVASYTGNGGYNSSPDDNCTSLHLINRDEMCAVSFPFTIVEYLESIHDVH